jgi:hypothetical protein
LRSTGEVRGPSFPLTIADLKTQFETTIKHVEDKPPKRWVTFQIGIGALVQGTMVVDVQDPVDVGRKVDQIAKRCYSLVPGDTRDAERALSVDLCGHIDYLAGLVGRSLEPARLPVQDAAPPRIRLATDIPAAAWDYDPEAGFWGPFIPDEPCVSTWIADASTGKTTLFYNPLYHLGEGHEFLGFQYYVGVQ